MKSPKVNVQTETPAEAAARAAEQQRAEAVQIQETQGLNAAATVRRTRRLGRLTGGSSATGTQPVGSFAALLARNGGSTSGSGGFSGSSVTFNGRGQAQRVIE